MQVLNLRGKFSATAKILRIFTTPVGQTSFNWSSGYELVHIKSFGIGKVTRIFPETLQAWHNISANNISHIRV